MSLKPLTQLFGALFPGHSTVKNLPSNAGDARDMDLIPGSGIPPGVGNGNPLQYWLGNPVGRGGKPGGLHSKVLQRVEHN